MRFTRWAAVPFALVYLILMAHRLEGAIVSTNLDADAASAPVISQLFGVAPAHANVVLGEFGWYATLLFDLATKWLPHHRQVWEGAPYAMALAGASLAASSVWQVAGKWAAGLCAVVLICASPATVGLLLSTTQHAPDWFCLALLGAFLVLLERRVTTLPVAGPRGAGPGGRNDRRRQRRLGPAGRGRRGDAVRARAGRDRGARTGTPQPASALDGRRDARHGRRSRGRAPRSPCPRYRLRPSQASTRRRSPSAPRPGPTSTCGGSRSSCSATATTSAAHRRSDRRSRLCALSSASPRSSRCRCWDGAHCSDAAAVTRRRARARGPTRSPPPPRPSTCSGAHRRSCSRWRFCSARRRSTSAQTGTWSGCCTRPPPWCRPPPQATVGPRPPCWRERACSRSAASSRWPTARPAASARSTPRR